MEVALDDAGGDGVFQVLLDIPAQVSRAVGDGVGVLHHHVQDGVLPHKGQVLFGQHVLELLEHDESDGAEVLLRELVEADHLVHAVDELGPQELL